MSSVELLRRYSNNPGLRDDLRHARQAVMDSDEDDEPELGGELRTNARRWRLADRLTIDAPSKIIESYRAGMTAVELAERFSISPSSVKRILRRAGVRKRRKPPS
jgi:DNA-directed RNA polymerase specialized sigma24 family protein